DGEDVAPSHATAPAAPRATATATATASAAAAVPARVPSDVPSAVRVPIEGLPVFGSAKALVTIVAFTDYECPYCAKADKTIAALRTELGDDVRVVLATRPLAMHEHAAPAARALLAAAEQGKAEAMHTRLFADRSALDDAGLVASARAIGLDSRAFESARTGPSTADALARVEALATSLDVNGTPTFFVNGRRMVGARTYDQFRALALEERTRAQEMVASGIAREHVYDALMAAAPVAAAPVRAPAIDDIAVEVAVEGAPSRGSAHAPVTIALFSDFECPYCVKAEATLRALEATYPREVRVAFRHRPLPMHEHARIAAKASLAAEAQGRFWEYHDVLVAHRDALDRASLEGYARTVGLDLARFGRDIDDPRFEARISADETQAAKLHVEGTPTAFVNGRRIVGAQPIAVYRAAVERALAGK
ncbi:MAG: DSBA-like thioredoxin protein, partial [Myxococcaceae bacterium]|nr:DSBA-like thioredoxin protein [Myxococcaceae bacterium]